MIKHLWVALSCSLALILLLATSGLHVVRADDLEVPGPGVKKHVRILTVGNSFTHNATEYLSELSDAAGLKLTHKMLSIGGSPLERHAAMAIAFEKDVHDQGAKYSGGESLQQALQSDQWDFVTIQQVSIKSHNLKTYHPYAEQLADIIRRHAPQSTLLVHQTWAYRKDDPRFDGTDDGDGEPADQSEMYQELTGAYKTITSELNAKRIPVGDAFWIADNDSHFGYQVPVSFDIEAATFPALPDQSHSLHVGYRWQRRQGKQTLRMDGHHASVAGKYLGACVWLECLFGQSPIGNSFIPKQLDPEYAKFLQRTAHRVANQGEDVVHGKPILPIPSYRDSNPQRYMFQVRASEIDPRTKQYPEIGFVFGSEQKPADLQFASVDTRVDPQGKLVIWLMANNGGLFERINQYGMHAISVSYARGWFGTLCRPRPSDGYARGRVRLEAATGLDFSDELDLAEPDGAAERARQLVLWLSEKNPQGNWGQFLSEDKRLRWDKIILAGSSHGSTTAARFAKHQRVDRVVMLCGPRDQDQDWQALWSATPAKRYFGFSHVLDGGWTGNHYCRSWELLGLHEFGPIVNIDQTTPPYENSRRLITAADVGGDAKRAHSAVQPGRSAPENEHGEQEFEPVWRYLFNHPIEQVGAPTELDPECRLPEASE